MRTLALIIALGACGPTPTAPVSSRNTTTSTAQQPLVSTGKERVHFLAGDAQLSAAERAGLEPVVRRLRADASLLLQISGHADATEPDGEQLGEARARAVRRHLVANGIAESRLRVRAVGAKEPRDTNATERGRARNRRVEFETVTIKVDAFGGRVVVTDSDVEIYDQVTFVPGTVKIEPTSFPILDSFAATLHGNPSIQLVEVQSHTDERGDDTANLRLTQARAKVVVAYLVSRGIDPARLDPKGYGETQPIDRGHDEAARAKNRRIAFVIVRRAP